MSVHTILGSLIDGYAPSVLLGIAAIFLMIWKSLSIDLDPREPPLLKPTVPFIGHIIGLTQHNISYFDKLFANSPKPIVTLPMLASRTYVITEPVLAQSAFRNKQLSFEPFISEISPRINGADDGTMSSILNIPEDEKEPSFIRKLIKEMHGSMASEHLRKMNATALDLFAPPLNSVELIRPESLFFWMRHLVTLGTCNALFGSHSPFLVDESLLDDIWAFDQGQTDLVYGIFPTLLASKAYKARARLQSALTTYYSAKYDKDASVSYFIQVRASVMRECGVSDAAIGLSEAFMPILATSNAVPTLYWLLCTVFSSQGTTLVQQIREELASIVTESRLEDGKRELTVDTKKLESHCPLLISSYRETMRLNNAQVGTRRVMENTILSDGKQEYLLRKGYDVMIPAGVAHMSSEHWGPNSDTFDSRRFLALTTPTASKTQKERDDEKIQKRAFFPFGGGKHLCPGRNFAFVEIMGIAAVLILGFDIELIEGGKIVIPHKPRARFGVAVGRPADHGEQMGAKISRREGWEDVVWKFDN